MIGTTVILLRDEWSNFGLRDKDRKPYGKKGEAVVVVSVHDEVLIVAGQKGKGFPVRLKDVTPTNNEKNKTEQR